ncbi:hypothetical protein [Serratia fonticola]|uniref:hypothetical protein n=1 Tax=Serratia fonticola TaxID=47917 RepID=UPI001415370D|nr:hypothetical protein [Serratia fonticola]QIP92764.1 hypothetical protein HAP32_03284 [Serratia fonticola]
MFLFDTNYPCSLKKIAFDSIVEALNAEPNSSLRHDESYVAFIDGDSSDIYSTMKRIYGLKKENKTIYVITLLSKGKECPAMVMHLSDFIVDKKIAFADLKNLVRAIGSAQPKTVADNIFGDIWGGAPEVISERATSIKAISGGVLAITDSQDAASVDKNGQWL